MGPDELSVAGVHCPKPAPPTTPPRALAAMRSVSGAIVTDMLADLPGETDRVLMDRFVISYNTWRKIRAGEPVRRSVAERLERRVARDVRQGQAEDV